MRNLQNNSQDKKKKFKFSSRAYYALAAVLVVICVQIFSLTVFFGITKVEVEGVTLYLDEQIVNVGGLEKGANLIRTDEEKIENRIKENLAFIDEVEVKKKYPSTIVISCKEAVKSVDIEDNGSYYTISESGRVLEAKNPQPTGDIPVVEGFELESLEVGEQLKSKDTFKTSIVKEIMSSIKKIEFEDITKIDITSRSNIILNYDDRINIKLGGSSDIDYKLTCFKAVIDSSLTQDYEGTLIYNGAVSGISAISKEQELSLAEDDSQEQDESSQGDLQAQDESSQADERQDSQASQWGENTQTSVETQQPVQEYTEAYGDTQTQGYSDTYENYGDSQQVYENNQW